MTGGSGRPIWSGFGRNCGYLIIRRSERMADRVYAYASSLDEPKKYMPIRSIYTESARPWDRPMLE